MNQISRIRSEASLFDVVGYELWMYYGAGDALKRRTKPMGIRQEVIHNSLVESRILHLRQIVDMLLSKSKHNDDITLERLIPNWASIPKLQEAINKLAFEYGGINKIDSPCWIINKMLAHATDNRSTSYNYQVVIGTLDPLIENILRIINGHSPLWKYLDFDQIISVHWEEVRRRVYTQIRPNHIGVLQSQGTVRRKIISNDGVNIVVDVGKRKKNNKKIHYDLIEFAYRTVLMNGELHSRDIQAVFKQEYTIAPCIYSIIGGILVEVGVAKRIPTGTNRCIYQLIN